RICSIVLCFCNSYIVVQFLLIVGCLLHVIHSLYYLLVFNLSSRCQKRWFLSAFTNFVGNCSSSMLPIIKPLSFKSSPFAINKGAESKSIPSPSAPIYLQWR